MDYENMRVVDLKALAKERGLRGYSRLKKAKLIAFIRDNLQPRARSSPREPIDDRPRPPPRPILRGLLQLRAPALQDLLGLPHLRLCISQFQA